MFPEIIISTLTRPEPAVVEFSELYAQKAEITQMTLLWTYNAYHVNIPEKYFIINGGRKLFFEENIGGPVSLLYARRKRKEMLSGADEVDIEDAEVSYLLGVENQDKQLFVHVTADGRAWAWKTKR